MPAKSVAGLNALVTGSGRGIGKEIARVLGKEGANFFLPGPRSPLEGVIRQLHYSYDRRGVRPVQVFQDKEHGLMFDKFEEDGDKRFQRFLALTL